MRLLRACGFVIRPAALHRKGVRPKKEIGPGRGELHRAARRGMRYLLGTDSALRGKQMQTEKEGSLSFAEAIIKVDIEYHMMHECMFCELEATKVTDR